MHQGVGYTTFRDQGTSPISYPGPGGCIGGDVRVELENWRFYDIVNIHGGIHEDAVEPLFNFSTFGGFAEVALKALHRCYTQENWQFWGGLSLDNYLGIKYNPNLNNASLGVTDFLRLNLHGRLEYHTSAVYTMQEETTVLVKPSRWCFFGELTAAPVGLAIRPGYSYIDNYNAGTSTLDTYMNEFTCSAVAFPTLKTDFGATLNLNNGNRISLSYWWGYNTTRNSGSWRFDEAFHLLVLNWEYRF